VLELAAGPADTGLMAAELVAPGGRAIITDNAEAMLEAAKARAKEVGATNVEIRPMEAEWIDLPTASVDAVLCRWGYMLLADPEAALRETRRVLRPGGRVALAAWAAPEHNPWIATIGRVMAELGHVEPPPPEAPGPLAFGRPGRIEELLDATAFDDIEVEPLDFEFHAADLDAWWEHSIAMSGTFSRLVRGLSPADHYALRDAVDAAYAPYVRDDGSLAIPARALVAAASA
jgi:SAM-dependent methyltransferase